MLVPLLHSAWRNAILSWRPAVSALDTAEVSQRSLTCRQITAAGAAVSYRHFTRHLQFPYKGVRCHHSCQFFRRCCKVTGTAELWSPSHVSFKPPCSLPLKNQPCLVASQKCLTYAISQFQLSFLWWISKGVVHGLHLVWAHAEPSQPRSLLVVVGPYLLVVPFSIYSLHL